MTRFKKTVFRTGSIYRIFPDHPRDANDTYFAEALAFLMKLGEKRASVEWFPAWLSAGQQSQASIEMAIRLMLKSCLTYFEGDEDRRTILLSAAAFRRVFKLLLVIHEDSWRIGEVAHFMERYRVPELSWRQIVSSPGRHLLAKLEGLAMEATYHFVLACRNEKGGFNSEIGKLQLKDLWKLEIALLGSVNYRELLSERGVGEIHPTEATDITYDFLGHSSLCLISEFPQWKDYVISDCHPQLEVLASMNSWKARELLGLKREDRSLEPSKSDLANRFFYGDETTLEALKAGYFGGQ